MLFLRQTITDDTQFRREFYSVSTPQTADELACWTTSDETYTIAASQVEEFRLWPRQMVLEPCYQLFPITEPVVRIPFPFFLYIPVVPVIGKGKVDIVFGHDLYVPQINAPFKIREGKKFEQLVR